MSVSKHHWKIHDVNMNAYDISGDSLATA
ncbi:unnamed protein product, partial [Rotaria sordida]